jgi:hypothetical protein
MQYLIAIHRPDGYDAGASEDDAMRREIDELNEAMIAAGVRRFVGGLQPVDTAVSLRPQPDGEVRVGSGPYLPPGEHVGGFWVLELAGLEDALDWGRKAAKACRAPVEVRPFH